MRLPTAVIKSHCAELEYFQRKLCLKDNGTNTEEILFLIRRFEEARSQMMAAKDSTEARTIFFDLLQDPRIHPLIVKYGLQ